MLLICANILSSSKYNSSGYIQCVSMSSYYSLICHNSFLVDCVRLCMYACTYVCILLHIRVYILTMFAYFVCMVMDKCVHGVVVV